MALAYKAGAMGEALRKVAARHPRVEDHFLSGWTELVDSIEARIDLGGWGLLDAIDQFIDEWLKKNGDQREEFPQRARPRRRSPEFMDERIRVSK